MAWNTPVPGFSPDSPALYILIPRTTSNVFIILGSCKYLLKIHGLKVRVTTEPDCSRTTVVRPSVAHALKSCWLQPFLREMKFLVYLQQSYDNQASSTDEALDMWILEIGSG